MGDVSHIGQLKPDPANPRSHNPRNVGLIVDSLQKVGAARSIVIDEDNVILAGNGVIEAAAQAGIEHVRVIEADGNEIIAVRRSGLTPEQRTLLKYYDNRATDLSTFDPQQIAADLEAGLDLSGMFFDWEIDKVLGKVGEGPNDPAAEWQGMPEFEQGDAESFDCIKVHFRNAEDRESFLALLGEKRDRRKSTWYPKMDYLKQSA